MTEADVARLYTNTGTSCFRRCHAYLGDPASAHDAVQEVFVRALGNAHTFRGDSSPRTWLCRIADHLCVDQLRRRSRNPVSGPAQFAVELAAHVRADDGDSLVMARVSSNSSNHIHGA
jgi:RNA polymerase sigma-70 factor (ECF subfamily)